MPPSKRVGSGPGGNEVDDAASRAAAALEAALATLARRPSSAARLRGRLIEKFGEEAAERAMARLGELDLVDDGAYAEAYARRRFETGGYGSVRIEKELVERGIESAVAHAAVSEVIDSASERERASVQLERFMRSRGMTAGPSAGATGQERETGGSVVVSLDEARARREAGLGRKGAAGEGSTDGQTRGDRVRAAAYRHLLDRGFPESLVCDLLDVSL